MEVHRFQVVIIGTGPGGTSAALRLARAGLRVAIIDERKYGGTCPNRGCDPKKIIRVGAELAYRSHQLARNGIVAPTRINWDRLMHWKRSIIEEVPRTVEDSLVQAGVTTYHGMASFIDAHSVRVGTQALSADRFIIATGSVHRPLPISGSHFLATSEEVLELDTLPDHALFVGGGYVSFELAHLLAACGVACTIVHADETPLPDFDEALVRTLIDSSREDGIEIVLGSEVTGIDQVGEGYHVHAVSEDEHHTYETDIAIHGAGRIANVQGLNLAAAGIIAPRNGIHVDEYLRASEHIYAIGDCADSGPAVTPVAQYHGRLVADILLGSPRVVDHSIIPRVLFTLPELASVGLTERDAHRDGIAHLVKNHETSSWLSSRILGQRHAGSRILVDPTSKRILGAHLFGSGSAETIHLFALAMREGVSADALANLIYAFPTQSSDIPSLL